MKIFKRTMTARRASLNHYFLGSKEDPDAQRRQKLNVYEEDRKKHPAFRGGVFKLLDGGLLLEKTEIWESHEGHLEFIDQHREFIDRLVIDYENYCREMQMQITRLEIEIEESLLNETERQACEQKTFIRIY